MSSSGVHSIWDAQSRWSQAAGRLKKGTEQWRWAALVLTVMAAALSAGAVVAGLDSSAGKWLAFVSGSAAAVAGLATSRTGGNAVSMWTRARSVSESIKSEVYKHLATQGSEADLDEAVADIEGDAADLLRFRDARKAESRSLPEVHDVNSYLDVRVRHQIDRYYRATADKLDGMARVYRWVEVVFAIAGAVLAVAAGTWEEDNLAVWVPAVTTVGAAVAAHAAAQRLDFLVVQYRSTADELARLANRRGKAAELSDEQLIDRAELVISNQNQGWMVKLSGGATD